MSIINPLKVLANQVCFSPQKYCLGMAVFWTLAVLLRWGIVPYYEKMPADYVVETNFAAKLESRQTPTSPPEIVQSVVRRRDQALASGDGHIIQGDAHWSTLAGVVIFETRSLYGVDRRNHQNLASYGDRDRTGQFLFPPHTQKQQYGLWDPVYAGPAVVTFDRMENFRRIEVYVFNFLIDGIDETSGFEALPDVPEKYSARTYAKGWLWVEPVSGIIVDREDSGVAYFIERKTGQRAGEPILEGSERYTRETIDAQFQLAAVARRRMLVLKVWLPLTFVTVGLICIAAGFRQRRRAAP